MLTRQPFPCLPSIPLPKAAYLLTQQIGGKMLVFTASAPTSGLGVVRTEENPALYNTDKEYSMRQPCDPFYKRLASDCSRS